MKLKVIDMFSGCCGFSTGFAMTNNFEIVAGNDNDDDCLAAFANNHPNAQLWHGSIVDLDAKRAIQALSLKRGELDVLIGGPPCQGFSRNRAHRHRYGRFVDDPRNYLFKEFLRFVKIFFPRAVVIENVPDMIAKENGKFKIEIFNALEEIGCNFHSAKMKSVSSPQLARDLDLTQQTAHYVQQRIRSAMADQNGGAELLQGIVEADETYIGGKPRRSQRGQGKCGRGTKKQPVVGAVERGGKVVAAATPNVRGKNLLAFLKANVDPDGSVLITDEFPAYNAVKPWIPHSIVNHQTTYGSGLTHTNTIEGFWSLLKRSWYGTHHHYRKTWLPLYVAEQCWKYNNRRNADPFGSFLAGALAP